MAIMHDRIKDLRNKRGFTLSQVADYLNVTEATAQRYETGKGIKTIPYDVIEKYANMFNCSPAYIMGWELEDAIEEYPVETGTIIGKAIKDESFLELLSYYNLLNDDKKKEALSYMKYLSQS